MRKLQAREIESCAAMLCAYQVWVEWGISTQEWRPLRGVVSDFREHDWEREDLTHSIEGFTVYRSKPGGLIICGLESGFITIELRQGISGLVLKGFWELNEHLDPNYRTIQQKGGAALAHKRRLKEIDKLAQQRQKLFQQQQALPFGPNKPTVEEEKACYALIIRIDRACGKPVRQSTEYLTDILAAALRVVKEHTPEEINEVEAFLIHQRETTNSSQTPDRVLLTFDRFLEEAQRA